MISLALLSGLPAARVVFSVMASALQKWELNKGTDSSTFWLRTYFWMLPAGTWVVFIGGSPGFDLPATFWFSAVVAGVLDAIGNRILLASLRRTDLSVFGSLNALRPVLALLFGGLFLNELPSFLGICGVLITAAGAILILTQDTLIRLEKGVDKLGILLRITGLALSTGAAVFLKQAILLGGTRNTLGIWIATGFLFHFVWSRFEAPKTPPHTHLLKLPQADFHRSDFTPSFFLYCKD
ncbi:MAG: hypothetical protein EXS25_08795 [Pedosphaera sp.]|nr:hypothetical protein [Pedosphaera sp.]